MAPAPWSAAWRAMAEAHAALENIREANASPHEIECAKHCYESRRDTLVQCIHEHMPEFAKCVDTATQQRVERLHRKAEEARTQATHAAEKLRHMEISLESESLEEIEKEFLEIDKTAALLEKSQASIAWNNVHAGIADILEDMRTRDEKPRAGEAISTQESTLEETAQSHVLVQSTLDAAYASYRGLMNEHAARAAPEEELRRYYMQGNFISIRERVMRNRRVSEDALQFIGWDSA